GKGVGDIVNVGEAVAVAVDTIELSTILTGDVGMGGDAEVVGSGVLTSARCIRSATIIAAMPRR
ncbi:MAG TPA: hypothetical protein VKX96_01850, partial [Chloroflexota bacterium]|nr:hypothetical protein [Chloroflexota bacterium]